MILLILVLITLTNYSCYAAINKVIENVYIDSLIERYLSEEKYLWESIYSNSSDRSHSNVNYILNRIRTQHDDIYNDRYLEYVMSVTYMSKFIKYVDFYNIENVQSYPEKYQQQIESLTKPQSESFMTLDMTFSAYNYTRAEELFREIHMDTESHCSTWSEEMESTSYKIYMFYEILSANILYSYMKSQRANMIQVVRNGFVEHDHEILRTRFNLMYNEIVDVARDNLRITGRITWICDKNATGEADGSREVTNFIRGYIDNQINLNEEKSCWGTCSDYKFARNYDCDNRTFCYDQKNVGEADPVCRGTIFDCGFIEEKMEVCPSMSGRNRRYEYVNYGCTFADRLNRTRCDEEGRFFGQSGNCEAKPKILKPFRNSWLVKCNYCFCYCDEHLVDSDRHFSLRSVVSDVRENMIISGVAIIKRNGIFSWKITQSKLLSHGRVQQYQSDPRIRTVIFHDFRRDDPGIIDGVDYHTLSWQNRSVNLDTIIIPQGCVVTGVRFVAEREYLSLEIRSTRFDFNSGILLDQNEWISKGYRDRTMLHIDRPEPNRYYDMYGAYLSEADFRPNRFVKFRPSDPDKDAAQTTVPFIDTQLVRPRNFMPLSGISLYYKGKPGLGGFIAPAVVIYDMSPHIGNRLYPTTFRPTFPTTFPSTFPTTSPSSVP